MTGIYTLNEYICKGLFNQGNTLGIKVPGSVLRGHLDGFPSSILLQFGFVINMKNFFLVLILASAALFVLVGLSESIFWARRGRRHRRSCQRQDCVLYDWTDFGSCSKTCGWGYVNQRRNIKTKSSCSGRQCPSASSPQRKRTRSCYSRCCPVNCLWTWKSWGSCHGCGMSQQTRWIRITQNPSCRGTPCPSRRSETRSCFPGV